MTDLNHSLLRKSDDDDNIDDSISSLHEDSYISSHSSENGLSKPDITTLTDNYPKIEIKSEEDNSYIIPTYEHRFSRSKISRTITFQTGVGDKIEREEYPKKKFEIATSSTITTFLINLVLYSQFTNPREIMMDKRIKAYFLVRDSKNDKFIYDINDILSVLSMENENEKNVNDFLKGMNDFFDESNYQHVKTSNSCYKIFVVGSIIFLAALISTGLFFVIYPIIIHDSNLPLTISLSVFLLFLSALMIYQIHSIKYIHIYTKFKILNYMVMNYARFIKYVESWNRSIFESNRIRVTIPVTIDYILFNMDPYQEIELKHNSMPSLRKAATSDSTADNINSVRETQLSTL